MTRFDGSSQHLKAKQERRPQKATCRWKALQNPFSCFLRYYSFDFVGNGGSASSSSRSRMWPMGRSWVSAAPQTNQPATCPKSCQTTAKDGTYGQHSRPLRWNFQFSRCISGMEDEVAYVEGLLWSQKAGAVAAASIETAATQAVTMCCF